MVTRILVVDGVMDDIFGKLLVQTLHTMNNPFLQFEQQLPIPTHRRVRPNSHGTVPHPPS